MPKVKKALAEYSSLFQDMLANQKVKIEDRSVFEQDFFDSIPVPVFLNDLEGKDIGVNQALVDFLGVERARILGQGVYHFLAPALVEEYRQRDAELLASGGRDSFESLVSGREGRERSVVFTRATTHDREGRIMGLIVTLFDLSELKEAQRSLGEVESQKQAILDGIPDTVALLDCDLQLIWTNREGYKERNISADPVENYCQQLFLCQKTVCADCAIRRSILSGKIEYGVQEVEGGQGAGEGKSFELVANPLKDGAGKVKGVVLISRDITERIKLEKQLRSSQKMAAIGTLAGGIAHDFNNVLTPIIGQAEIVRFRMRQRGQHDPDLENSIAQILTAAKRAKRLVEQIQTFSRSQEKRGVASYLHPVIKEVMDLVKVGLPSTIEIRQAIDRECGQVVIDTVQLHQLLMNLCVNSFHAMDGRGGILTVRLVKEEDQEGRKWVVLSVADTGTGIEPSVLPRIFEPYYSTKDKSRGTGMGLAMVHGIVSGHGGRVEVKSEVGVGTTFKAYLPVASVAAIPVESALVIPALVGGKEHILVVDDEEQVLDVITNILKGLGYRVTGTTSGQEALLLFRQAAPDFDLLVSDLTMPLVSGVDLCVEIKKDRPDLPLILCSGDLEQITTELRQRSGVDECFAKPISIQGLAQVVRRALDQK